MRKLVSLVLILSVLSVLLSGCDKEGGTVLAPEPDPEKAGFSANYGSLQEIEVGTPFTYINSRRFTGTMECTVTDVRVVTEESQCPPEEWFFSSLSVINMETGWSEGVERNEWFTEGGAFDQGCRILVVDVTLKNIDAEGLPDDAGGISDDPTAFEMTYIMNMVDTGIVLNGSGDYPTYQGYSEMGFSQLNQFIPDEYVDSWDPFIHWDSNAVQLPKGETVSFSLCYPIYQNNDGSPKDFSKLAIIANESIDEKPVIIPLHLEG